MALGGKDSVDRSIADYKEKWVRTIERAGGEFLPAKGNHDFTIRILTVFVVYCDRG